MKTTAVEIDRRIEQLKARKNRLLARENSQDRKRRTRQAAILGSWLIANDPTYVEKIKATFVRPQDIAAFAIQQVSP